MSSVKGKPKPSKGGKAGPVTLPDVPKLLNIGYGNVLVASRVVAVVSSQPAPMRRLREDAAARGKLVDATQGRRTRAILITDSDHIVLSAVNPETLASRLAADGSSL